MLSSSSKSVINIEHHKNLQVQTPRWRILEIEPSNEIQQQSNNTEQEQLDDLTFINRHQLKELRERNYTIKINKKNKSNLLVDDTPTAASSSSSSMNSIQVLPAAAAAAAIATLST